jgi:hypothetical protein
MIEPEDVANEHAWIREASRGLTLRMRRFAAAIDRNWA